MITSYYNQFLIKIETWTKEVRKINNNNSKVAEYQSKLKVAEYQKLHEEEIEEEKQEQSKLFHSFIK